MVVVKEASEGRCAWLSYTHVYAGMAKVDIFLDGDRPEHRLGAIWLDMSADPCLADARREVEVLRSTAQVPRHPPPPASASSRADGRDMRCLMRLCVRQSEAKAERAERG